MTIDMIKVKATSALRDSYRSIISDIVFEETKKKDALVILLGTNKKSADRCVKDLSPSVSKIMTKGYGENLVGIQFAGKRPSLIVIEATDEKIIDSDYFKKGVIPCLRNGGRIIIVFYGEIQ